MLVKGRRSGRSRSLSKNPELKSGSPRPGVRISQRGHPVEQGKEARGLKLHGAFEEIIE